MVDSEPSGDPNEPFAGHIRKGSRFIQDWPGDRTYGPDKRPFGQGQCAACGFLSRRSIDRAHPGVEEVSVDDRTFFRRYFFMLDERPSVPWCLVHAADLPGETQAFLDFTVEQSQTASNPIPAEDIFESRGRSADGGPTHRDAAASMVISKDRKCPEWYPYREFLSPVEHRQERDVLRLEEERKAHAQQLAEMQAEIHKGTQTIQADSLAIAKALQASSEATGRFTTRWTYVAAAIALGALAVVVATYLWPDFGRQLAAWLSAGWDEFVRQTLRR